MTPKRADIWWVAFPKSVGGEVRKDRPCVVVSNDAANTFLNRVTVVPLTSSVARLYPSEAWLTLNGIRNKAMADQLTTVSKERLSNKAGDVSEAEMDGIERAIRVHLGMR